MRSEPFCLNEKDSTEEPFSTLLFSVQFTILSSSTKYTQVDENYLNIDRPKSMAPIIVVYEEIPACPKFTSNHLINLLSNYSSLPRIVGELNYLVQLNSQLSMLIGMHCGALFLLSKKGAKYHATFSTN
jgi:hypothetical protein